MSANIIPFPPRPPKADARELRRCLLRARLREILGITGKPIGRLRLASNIGSPKGATKADE